MYKAYKFRIYPNKEQEIKLSQFFWATRWLYNYWLSIKIENHKQWIKTKKYDIQWLLPKLKEENVWLKGIHSQVLQITLLELNNAFTNFFRSNASFPKFKSKRKSKKTFSYPQWVYIKDKKIFLPKIWFVNIKQHRELLNEIRTCTISQTPTWKYYISILQDDWTEIKEKIKPTKEKCLWIDMWIKDFAICSNWEVFKNPKWMKKYERRLKIRQRKFSKKEKWSENKNKYRLRINWIYEKITNQRKDYIHKVTNKIVNDNQVNNFALEKLNIKGMMKNHRLAWSIWQASWYMFKTFLEYKSNILWKSIIEIWTFEPSSKICCKCWNIKKDLQLKDRIYKCDKCWNEIDRDYQASINIKDFAYKSV